MKSERRHELQHNALLDWLRTNIHGRGRQTTLQPLFEEVTGSRLDAGFFKRHLAARYLG